MARYFIRFGALGYLLVLLILPLILVALRTFEGGVGPVIESLTSPEATHAMKVTLIVALSAVVLNTVFGVGMSILLVRHRFPGRRLMSALVDLPLAVSPVVVGLALILVYGRLTTVGSWLSDHGIDIIYALPGMVIATIFVSFPLVVRELVPVLEEIGIEQEEASRTLGASWWQTFWRVTLPSIRGALAYGVVLSLARSLGEYGAVAVVSGKIVGRTQTMTLFVEERFQGFDRTGAYSAAFALAMVAVLALVGMQILRRNERS